MAHLVTPVLARRARIDVPTGAISVGQPRVLRGRQDRYRDRIVRKTQMIERPVTIWRSQWPDHVPEQDRRLRVQVRLPPTSG
jgi:hypothetical protein